MTLSPVAFRVETASGVPIYRQIVDQVRARIAGGSLRPGDGLPSVRQLAAHLQVNPMTISKAYTLLENDGLLRRARGVGMHVAESQSRDTVRQRQQQLDPLIEQLVAKAKQLALTQDQTLQYVEAALKALPEGTETAASGRPRR